MTSHIHLGGGISPLAMVVVIVIFVLIVAKGVITLRVGLALLAGLVALGVVMLIGSLSFMRQTARHTYMAPSPPQAPAAPKYSYPSNPPASNADWTAMVKDGFEPDVYPSLASAAEGTAVKLVESLEQVAAGEGVKGPLIITGNVGRDVLGRVGQAVRRKVPSIAPVVQKGPIVQPTGHQTVLEIKELPLPAEEELTARARIDADRANAISVVNTSRHTGYRQFMEAYKQEMNHYKEDYRRQVEAYKVRVKQNPGQIIPFPRFTPPGIPQFPDDTALVEESSAASSQPSRTLELTLHGPSGSFTRQAQFVDKPWADNFGEFVNRNPGQSWILAGSSEPCASQSEAHEKALENAVAQFLPRLRDRLEKRPENGWFETFGRRYEDENLPQFIRGSLDGSGHAEDNLIQDKFCQRFDRPYGQVWRESLLIDGRVSCLDGYARQYNAQYHGAKASWVRMLVSTLAMVILVCVVYAFANAATRGYYTWTLRTMSILLVLGVIFLLIFMA